MFLTDAPIQIVITNTTFDAIQIIDELRERIVTVDCLTNLKHTS